MALVVAAVTAVLVVEKDRNLSHVPPAAIEQANSQASTAANDR